MKDWEKDEMVADGIAAIICAIGLFLMLWIAAG